MSINREEIQRILNSDETQLVGIMKRDDGFYQYIEERIFSEEGHTYWCPVYWSGIYDELERTEQEARQRLGEAPA
jgi:hypothetical protein